MTLVLPQVCELRLGVSKGMLTTKAVAPKITSVRYSGQQLLRRLGWVVAAYLKNEDATPHPECVTMASNVTGGVTGALGCRLGRGTWIGRMERKKFVKN